MVEHTLFVFSILFIFLSDTFCKTSIKCLNNFNNYKDFLMSHNFTELFRAHGQPTKDNKSSGKAVFEYDEVSKILHSTVTILTHANAFGM